MPFATTTVADLPGDRAAVAVTAAASSAPTARAASAAARVPLRLRHPDEDVRP